ncbi:MAG: hypothetical protein JXK94_00305 [Deltaproteobacteria bacterium]|nr:hypothetical protein [Deltaproteobacteria bacterium]
MRRIENNNSLPREEAALWLENAVRGLDNPAQVFVEKEMEFFVVEDGALSVHHFILDRENKTTGQVFKRRLYYKLKHADHDDLEICEFLYP